MELFTKDNYTIVAETWETRTAWGHKATLIKTNADGYSITMATNKIRYYNRTWESYQYQSVVKGLIYKAIQEQIDADIDNYKFINNIKRLTASKKQDIIAKSYTHPYIKTLKEWYDTL